MRFTLMMCSEKYNSLRTFLKHIGISPLSIESIVENTNIIVSIM